MIKSASLIFCCVAGFILLTGCGNQAFDCPHKEGVRCMRLSEVDKQISAGGIGLDSKVKNKVQKIPSMLSPPEPSVWVQETAAPSRSREEVLSIWMAPYQSEDGTYHEQNVLHFVAKEAAWTVPYLSVENHGEQADAAKP